MSATDSEPASVAGDSGMLSNTCKRSYDQLDTGDGPATGESSSMSSPAGGSDRHKRARSHSHSEDGASRAIAEASMRTSPNRLSTTLEQLSSMPGPSGIHTGDVLPEGTETQYDLSLERFSHFDDQMEPSRRTPEVTELQSTLLDVSAPIQDEEEPAETAEDLFAANMSPDEDTTSLSPASPRDVLDTRPPFPNNEDPSRDSSATVEPHFDEELRVAEQPNYLPTVDNTLERAILRQLYVDQSPAWLRRSNIPTPSGDTSQDGSPSLVSGFSSNTGQRYPHRGPNAPRPRLPSLIERGHGSDSLSSPPLPLTEHDEPYRRAPSPLTGVALTERERDIFRRRRVEEMRRRVQDQRRERIARSTASAEQFIQRYQHRENPSSAPRARSVDPDRTTPGSSSAIFEGSGTLNGAYLPTGRSSRGFRSTTPEFYPPLASVPRERPMRSLVEPASHVTGVPVITSNPERRAGSSAYDQADERRRSLLMGWVMNSPEVRSSRPSSRRALQTSSARPAGSTLEGRGSRNTSPSHIAPLASPSQSPTEVSQSNRAGEQPTTSRAVHSRPPPWMLASSSSTERSHERPLPLPNATSGADPPALSLDTSAATLPPVSGPHIPAIASPLRQVYVAPSQSPSRRAFASREGVSSSNTNYTHIASHVQALSPLLTRLAASSHASEGVRDAAVRLITSGQALLRAMNTSARGPGSIESPSVTTALSSNSTQEENAGSRSAISSGHATASSAAVASEISSLTERLNELTEGTVYRREMIADQNLRQRSSGSPLMRARPSQRPPTGPTATWHSDFDTTAPSNTSLSRLPITGHTDDRTQSLMPYLSQLEEVPPWVEPSFAHDEEFHGRTSSDRWTQARQRRRELQDALLVEESRIFRAAQGTATSHPPPRFDMRLDFEMDVDSEDEVEIMFALGQESVGPVGDDDRDVATSRNTSPAVASLVTSGTNSSASATALRSSSPRNGNPSRNSQTESSGSRQSVPVAAPHQVIDLNAYHDGPFRGALARAVQVSRQNESRRRQPRPSATPASSSDPRSANYVGGSARTETLEERAARVLFNGESDRIRNPPPHAPSSPMPRSTRAMSITTSAASASLRRLTDMFSDLDADESRIRELEGELHRLDSMRSWVEAQPNRHPSAQSTTMRTNTDGAGREGLPNILRMNSRSDLPTAAVDAENSEHLVGQVARHSRLPRDLQERWFFDAFRRHHPRGVPQDIMSRLESGTYSEWSTPETETQCPICFEDYGPSDPVLRLPKCKHWFHKPCIEEWFKSASTCPICRDRISDTGSSARYRRAIPAPARRDSWPPINPFLPARSPSTANNASLPRMPRNQPSRNPRVTAWREGQRRLEGPDGDSRFGELFPDYDLLFSPVNFPSSGPPSTPGTSANAGVNLPRGPTAVPTVNRNQDHTQGNVAQAQHAEQANSNPEQPPRWGPRPDWWVEHDRDLWR